MTKKSCGVCYYFLKCKNDKYGSGICMFYDRRVQSSEPTCKYYQRRPYSRLNNKKETNKIIKEFNNET